MTPGRRFPHSPGIRGFADSAAPIHCDIDLSLPEGRRLTFERVKVAADRFDSLRPAPARSARDRRRIDAHAATFETQRQRIVAAPRDLTVAGRDNALEIAAGEHLQG